MGRVTRSSGAFLDKSEVSDSPLGDIIVSTEPMLAPDSKPRRGRPSNGSAAASTAISSTSTSIISYSSGSEYGTPLTSSVPTPAPAAVSEPTSTKTSRIEVRIPARAPADSHRALRQSIYAMKTTKRKRDVVEDSEDDDDYDLPGPADSRVANDSKLAQKLQEEEYSRNSPTSLKFVPPPVLGLRRSARNSLSENAFFKTEPDDQSEKSFTALATSLESSQKGKGKESAVFRATYGRQVSAASTISKHKRRKVPQIPDEVDTDPDESPLTSASDSEFEDAGVGAFDGSSEAKRRVSRRTAIASKTTNTKPRLSTTPLSAGDFLTPPPLAALDELASLAGTPEDAEDSPGLSDAFDSSSSLSEDNAVAAPPTRRAITRRIRAAARNRRGYRVSASTRREMKEQERLEKSHPELRTMWKDLEDMPVLRPDKAEQPRSISRLLKPFQLEGLAWMVEMETTKWKGGLLGDEMGLGKTIQAVSLIMSDFPQKQPTLVLVPPVALMQWQSEIESYTDGTLKVLVFHGTNAKSKNLTVADLKKYNVIIMSYNSLESMYRKQEKGFKRKDYVLKEKSIIHQTKFHRAILDEAHSIKTRTTMTAKACFALQAQYRWCLSGTPLQNRIGEFFSLIRFLNVQPFSSYLCKMCPCTTKEWTMNEDHYCVECKHPGMQHISIFNHQLLSPIQKYGNVGQGAVAFRRLRILTDRIMLRRLKKDHTNSMELPVKEIFVDRQFFGAAENDFANSIMTQGQRSFDTYVSTGVLLNNYANIFGLIMQMRQVADHPDLILKKSAAGGQNILVCCICDEPAEDAIRSKCNHDFCRECVKSYLNSLDGVSGDAPGGHKKGSKAASEEPRCPACHGLLTIDLEQPEMEQDEGLVKKSSIINRIKMENWTSSSKIELLVHSLHKLRSDHASHKSIIFSQFTTMLQLVEWRLRRAGITSVMLDGSMTPAQRQASIDHFMNNVEVECFLVSLKAGGVALNLTEASHVFIVDPWWNPAAEWQSADRCHRIGQTRPCTITRLCIEDSVESRMVLLQEKKSNMIKSTINADDKAMDSLSPEDLEFLFRGN